MEARTRPARRRGLPRVEQVAHNRRRLLDAAGAAFRELGYGRATLDDIADRAGFSKGAVYSHFTSKADLFLSLLEDRVERRAAGQRELVSTATTTDDVARLLREVYETSRRDPLWQLVLLEFRVIAARDPALNDRYAAVHRRTLDGIAATLRTAFAAAGIEAPVPMETLAMAGVAMDVGCFLEDALEPGTVPAAVAAALFAGLAGLPVDVEGGGGWSS